MENEEALYASGLDSGWSFGRQSQGRLPFLQCSASMATDDFDIVGLAGYFHISVQQVEKLISRGKLPGRKVAGQWRFSRAEIHHWMEDRMGLLEEDELVQVEGALERASSAADLEPSVSLTEIVLPAGIAIPLRARTRSSAIHAMVELAAGTGLLWDPEQMEKAVRAREDIQSTAMDNGVALLHPRRPRASILAEPLVTIGVCKPAIPFGGSRRLTDVMFLICSTDDQNHLYALARLSRLLSDAEFLPDLRGATDAQQAHDAVVQAEARVIAVG